MKHLVTRKEKSAVEVKLILTKEEIKPIKEGIILEVAKKVEVPGFRKGHAPADKVESNFPDAVKEELVEAILKAHYSNVLEAEKINPVSYIYNVEPKNTDEGLELSFTVDEFPVVTLGEYKGLEITKKEVEFKEENLENEIKNLLLQKSTLEEAESGYKAVIGDTVDLAFDGSIDGVPFEGGKAESHELKLGSKMFIDNFEDQLVGYVAGQEGNITVTFPENYGHAPLAGKPAIFKVKINSIKKSKLAELNDELAKTLNAENVEDLKSKMKSDIISRDEQNAKNEMIGELLGKISDGAKVDIPNSMTMKEVENKLKEIEQNLSAQGANLETYLKMMGKTIEEVVKEMTPSAENKIKTDLILEEIANKENITLTDEEVNSKMEEMSKIYGMTLEKLEEELKKHNNLEAFKANLKIDATLQKVVEFLLENAKKK